MTEWRYDEATDDYVRVATRRPEGEAMAGQRAKLVSAPRRSPARRWAMPAAAARSGGFFEADMM